MKMIVHRLMAAVMTVALLVSLGAFSGASAFAQGQTTTDAPGQWASAINLQNIGTATATGVRIDFYDGNGTNVGNYVLSAPLAVNGAVSVYLPTAQVQGLGSGQFSAVVSSDQPIQATVNTGSNNSSTPPYTIFGYEGIDSAQAGTTLFFPGNYNNYFGFYSEIVVQNTSASAVTLNAAFFNRNGGQIGSAALGSLAPNASKTFPMSKIAGLPSGNTAVFGAVVTATGGSVVGIANIWQKNSVAGTASYNAFTAGSKTLYVPALYNNYFGFVSSLTIQAVGGAAAGTITYSNGATQPFNLAANAAAEYFQPSNAALPSGNTNGVFSAKVTTTSGNVVGLVNIQIKNSPNGDFASYNALLSAGSQLNVAGILSDYFGFFSAVTVQNAGTTATNITITYANGQSRTFPNIPGGGTINIVHLNSQGDILPDTTSTSAVVSSSNGNPLVAVIQTNTNNTVKGFVNKTPRDYLVAVVGSVKTP